MAFDDVADPADGVDQPVRERVVNLRAEPADMDVDHVAVAVEVHVPDLLGDQRPRQHLALAAGQQREQGELLRRQVEPPVGPRRRAAQQIDPQVADGDDLRLPRRAAPKDGADAGEQFREGERLDEVVVGPGLQTLHPVLHRVPRRQQQHGRRVAPAAQLAQQRQPVEARQHHVEHDQVEMAVGGQPPSLRPGLGDVDDEAVLRQPLAQERGRLALVLDYQDLHRLSQTGLPSP